MALEPFAGVIWASSAFDDCWLPPWGAVAPTVCNRGRPDGVLPIPSVRLGGSNAPAGSTAGQAGSFVICLKGVSIQTVH